MGVKNYSYKYFAKRAVKVPNKETGQLKIYGVGEEIPSDAMDARAFERLTSSRVGWIEKVIVVDKENAPEVLEGIKKDLESTAKPKYGRLKDEIAKAKAAEEAKAAEAEKLVEPTEGKVKVEAEKPVEPKVDEKPKWKIGRKKKGSK